VLQHVTLELRREDWEAAKRFWSLVGFEQVEPPGPLGERSAWVERHGTQIHLQWHDEPVAPPEGHAAVVVDDWEGAVARLREEGFEVDEGERAWGAARCFVRAPGGHRVELMAAPPPPTRA
jgi:catechol 2,3-dioxygenase-like lactoylglutathione lyase family enzyme